VAEPLNYNDIIDQLNEATEQKKVKWEPVFSENAFLCVLKGEFTFKIGAFQYQGEERVFLAMTDKENTEVFRIVETAAFGPLGMKLSALHELARRDAVGVDEKIDAAKSILKNILGRN